MNLRIAYFFAAAFASATCTSAKKENKNEGNAAAVSNVEIAVELPDLAEVKAAKGGSKDELTHYRLVVSEVVGSCPAGNKKIPMHRVAVAALANSKPSLIVPAQCSYDVELLLGKQEESEDVLEFALGSNLDLSASYYQTSEPLRLTQKELQAKKTFYVELELELTAQGKSLEFSPESLKTSVKQNKKSEGGEEPEEEKEEESPFEKPGEGGKDPKNEAGKKVSYQELKPLISRYCVSCHPGRGQSDLSSYTAFKARAEDSVARVKSGSMPQFNTMQRSEIELFEKWLNDGMLENSSTSDTPSSDSVEFRIAAGTGSKAWNSSVAPVQARVGQKLKIINDDSVSHQLHTNGAPCAHGDPIRPGGSTICNLQRAFNGKLYDHQYQSSGFFYLNVTN